MLWENSSVAAVAVAVAVVVAHPNFGKWAVIGFYYGVGASGVRGSIRLVFRVPTARILRKVVVGKPQILQNDQKPIKTAGNGLAQKSPITIQYINPSLLSP